jgi:hypothetical protein
MATVSFLSRRAKNQTNNKGIKSDDSTINIIDDTDAKVLRDAWNLVLKTNTIDPEDNFFALGGTSLHAMLMASKIESSSQFSIDLVKFFDQPTFFGLLNSIKN